MLIQLIVAVIILGIAMWIVSQLPIAPLFKNVIYGIAAIILVLWLASALGFVHAPLFR